MKFNVSRVIYVVIAVLSTLWSFLILYSELASEGPLLEMVWYLPFNVCCSVFYWLYLPNLSAKILEIAFLVFIAQFFLAILTGIDYVDFMLPR